MKFLQFDDDIKSVSHVLCLSVSWAALQRSNHWIDIAATGTYLTTPSQTQNYVMWIEVRL